MLCCVLFEYCSYFNISVYYSHFTSRNIEIIHNIFPSVNFLLCVLHLVERAAGLLNGKNGFLYIPYQNLVLKFFCVVMLIHLVDVYEPDDSLGRRVSEII